MGDSMRSLNSFGVAGLLGPDCEVFYTNELRARNVGRISDLVSAQIRDSNADELRIRALLVYGVFQTYAVRNSIAHHNEAVPAASVEIGIDPSYVAVAITFHWDGKASPKWKGMPERVDSGQGIDPFENILEWIHRHSTQLIVRYEEKERRIEVVALMNRSDSAMKDPTMVVQVNSATAPLLEVSNYHELGDLDYSKLLRNPTATAEDVKVKGDEPSDMSKSVFKADSPLDSEANELRGLVAEYEKVISGLKTTVNGLETRLEVEMNRASERHFKSDARVTDDSVITVPESKPEDSEKKEDDWGFHFMKKVWPFSKPEANPEKITSESVPLDSEASVSEVQTFKPDVTDDDEITVVEDVNEDPVIATEASIASTQALGEIAEIAKGPNSKKMETTLREIEKEVDEGKAKRWVDSLSSELLQEKAKLNELQKNLAKQIRQRELEFKTAERSLKQELKRKDEVLRGRESAIENKNEQIAQLNLAVERAGAATVDKEQGQIKMKLDRAQRMAQMKEEEAKSLVVKMRDLENRLIIAQAKAQKGTDLQLTSKVQTLEKKVDEYKRVNQRLMESLNQTKDKSSDKEMGDLRRKIEQLERQSTETKRSLDKSAFKLKELQDSERKLQTDLARAVEENRNLRKNQGRGSGESGGGQAAA